MSTNVEAVDIEAAVAEVMDRGYTILDNLLPGDASTDAAQALLALDVGKGAGGDSSMFANLPQSEWGPFIDRATHPVVLKIARTILGNGIKMIGDIGRLWARPGEDVGTGGFHSDLPVSGWWAHNDRPFPVDCPSVQTIWALTDFTIPNGATGVVPFSHTTRHAPRSGIDYTTYEHALEMPAGSVAVMHCALWHRKRSNLTTADRVGLSIPYVARWLDPTTTWAIRMPLEVWSKLPAEMQELNPHTATPSNVPRYDDSY